MKLDKHFFFSEEDTLEKSRLLFVLTLSFVVRNPFVVLLPDREFLFD